jgi:transcriptional regulator with XRE-family HTH domain
MGNEVDRHLGRRLWQRRRSLGLTQQQLAQAIGVAFQQIQKYECGRSRLSASRLWSVCNALQVDMNYFFDGLDQGKCSSILRAKENVA